MHVLHDMAYDEDDKLDYVAPIKIDTPDYPYGLRVCLSNAEIRKLGIDPSEAVVGGHVMAHCLMKVTSVSCDQTDEGEKYRIEFQIEEMGVDSDEAEEVAAERPKMRSLYKSMPAA